MDELRFRNSSRLPQPPSVPSAHDPRTSLPRRFTTDSGLVPTLSTLTSQRGPEPQDFSATAALHKVQLLEKKRIEYERLREQKRRFEAEMQKLDQQQRREEKELAQMQEDLGRFGGPSPLPGRQSEPTTPPEYRETSSGFPTMFSRPNRYSTSSLTSPPGLYTRPGRSGSQLASPQSGIIQSQFAYDDQLPSRSVPGSRRNSDEDDKEEAVRQDPTSYRATNALNRYSMPVTRSRNGFYDIGSLDQTNTTRFLFGDEDNSGENKSYSHVNSSDDGFPTLLRTSEYPNMLSASTAAVDLALSQEAGTESSSSPNGWGVNRHRHQQSLSTIGSSQHNGAGSVSSAQSSELNTTISGRPSSIRGQSLEMKYYDSSSEAGASVVSPAPSHHSTPPKLTTSYSANDVPTVKNAGGSMTAQQQQFHNHNASLGRIPPGALPNRHSRELSNDNSNNANRDSGFSSIGSTLQANAAPFGPTATQAPSATPAVTSPPANAAYSGYYSGPGPAYNANNASNINGSVSGAAFGGVPILAMMQGMSLNGGSNNAGLYHAQNFTGFGAMYPQQTPPQRDSQARVIQNRRALDNEAMSRYNNLPLESVGGTIYDLCKDQHGCRYLQKQLENRNPDQIHMIWLETNQHVVELMTDPFGNYLCQKLLEYCNDEERTVLIQNASQDMVRIALNQHGTRALQKMIEFISTSAQVGIIVEAFRDRVVELIQDLNGNHVIQKCLNKLSPLDAQFIFDAVGNNCVEVGTHRHGCCVLQRCIDHASGDQKVWLIQRITDNACNLVVDPFGNYVVQYIIDLNEPSFTEPLVSMFKGRIPEFSRHKFSSNVVEKCLRCAQAPSKDLIAEELLGPGEMDRLLRDQYANYVIQTALDYATPYMKHRLIETIRPTLPAIRSTPYGRRIQAKVQSYDARNSMIPGDQITPTEATQGQLTLRPAHNRVISNNTSIITSGVFANGIKGVNGINGINGNRTSAAPAYPPSNVLTVPPPQPQRNQPLVAPPYPRSGGMPAENGEAQWL